MEYKITTRSEFDTIELAQNIESEKFENMVICLDGELGSGKTVFTKGFANALGVEENITYVKLEQNTLALEQGVAYKVSFKIKSSIARRVDIAVQNVDNDWLGGTTVDVGANTEEWQLVEFEVTPSGAANRFCVSMGQIDSEPYGTHTIEIDDVSIKE